jgi:hypothetical protein
MKYYDFSFVLKSSELVLLKIDYPYNQEELDSKLDHLSKQECAFISVVNQRVPISYWFHAKGYTEIDLIDQDTFADLKVILEKYEIEYQVTDYSEELFKDSEKLHPRFKGEILHYIDCVMDLDNILDRILEHGSSSLTSFELFYLQRLSNGTVSI